MISRIRSGLKLNATTLSPSRIIASSPTSTGLMNSSVSPRSYASRAASRRGRGVVLGAAVNQQVVGERDAIPALVAVHRVVTADDRADPAAAGVASPLLDLLEKAGTRMRQRVPPVGERMNHEVADAQLASEADQRAQVFHARVHAAGRHQPDQMHASGVGEGSAQNIVGAPARRPPRPRRSWSGPASRPRRRRGSGGRPRSCPSGRREARRRAPRRRGGCADTSPTASRTPASPPA